MARLVLVEGRPQSEVARLYGVKQPRVAYLVRIVKDPPKRVRGLVRIGGLVSVDTATKVREIVARAKVAKAAQTAQEAAERALEDEYAGTYSSGEIIDPDAW
jgi:hypothetical protein